MKHTIIYSLSAVAVIAMMAACEKEKPSQEEILGSRESVAIEVSYADEGTPVTALAFGHNAASHSLQVKVNSENLRWKLESNAPWCRVLEQEQKGSGTVRLEIDGNEDFEARNPATLTFVAGAFRGFQLTVSQSATAFVVSQPYFVAPMEGGSYSTRVVTPKGEDWTWTCDEWLTVTVANTASTKEHDITDLSISVGSNLDVSRYGVITLRAGEDKEELALWQFGIDMGYDSEGNIFFGNDERAVMSFTAPAFCIKDVLVPSYGKAEVENNSDGTATVIVSLNDNLSDCALNRTTDIKLVMNNLSKTRVDLPGIVQEYSPAHGLMTGPGLVAFAKAVASGASTEDWERDGVVTVLQDIDMADVQGWTGIGSAEVPFSGSFDGGGFAVTNLKGTGTGIFNYTDGATIRNIRLGKGSSIFFNKSCKEDAYFGGIVSYATNTLLSGCSMAAAMEFSGSAGNDASAYVGGIAGWCDATSRIQSCRFMDQGSLIITSPAAQGATVFAGGIAGLCEGGVTASEMSGELKFSSAGSLQMGGIQGTLVQGATVGGNAFNGTLILGGSASGAAVGGLYGSAESDRSFDATSDKSISLGTIQIDSYSSSEQTCVFAGGFIGLAQPEVNLSFKGYEMQSTFRLDQASGQIARYICIGGVLGGCTPGEASASLNFTDMSNSGTVTLVYGSTPVKMRHGLFGGIAGYVNCPATLTGCVNKGAIGGPDPSGNSRCNESSNNFCEIIGGMVGCAHGGDMLLESCINAAAMQNLHFSNMASTSTYDGMYSAQAAGGLVGAYNYTASPDKFKLTVRNCTNTEKGQVLSFRGYAGGIVGFCRNGVIQSSSSSGGQAAPSNDNAFYRGGIAGGFYGGSITGCWASCSISSAASGTASEASFSGGIIGWVMGNSTVSVEACSFNGRINSTQATGKPVYPGGLVGAASANTTVKNCDYGGNVQGVDITVNNASTPRFAVGNYDVVACTLENIGYWDGKNQ